MTNMAELRRAQGRYTEARELHERALAVREKTLGKEHPQVAQTLAGLAATIEAQGDYPAAQKLYERALAIALVAHGPDHPTTASFTNDLGNVLLAQGQYEQARALHERALAISEKVHEADHPTIAFELTSLADVLVKLGRFAEARDAAERALRIREAKPTPPGRLAETRFVLAKALAGVRGESARAIEFARAAAAGFREDGLASSRKSAEVETWLAAHGVTP